MDIFNFIHEKSVLVLTTTYQYTGIIILSEEGTTYSFQHQFLQILTEKFHSSKEDCGILGIHSFKHLKDTALVQMKSKLRFQIESGKTRHDRISFDNTLRILAAHKVTALYIKTANLIFRASRPRPFISKEITSPISKPSSLNLCLTSFHFTFLGRNSVYVLQNGGSIDICSLWV